MKPQSQIESPSSPVVDVAWLAARLGHPNLRILDTRGAVPAPGSAPVSRRAEHLRAHIPGAAFVDWHLDFVDPDDPVPNQLAGPERFADSASRLGIGDDTLVVAYDDARSIFAARLWWAFRAMGHDAVRVLDGGWTAWRACGLPVEAAAVEPRRTTFVARPRAQLRSTLDDVRELVAERAAPASATAEDSALREVTVLVDARSRARFAGGPDQPDGGHIPGASNAPYEELVGADGLLRPAAELTATLAAAGIDAARPPARIVASCGSGISASVPLLALELLTPGAGIAGSVYDGSWGEWAAAAGDPASGCRIERDAPGSG